MDPPVPLTKAKTGPIDAYDESGVCEQPNANINSMDVPEHSADEEYLEQEHEDGDDSHEALEEEEDDWYPYPLAPIQSLEDLERYIVPNRIAEESPEQANLDNRGVTPCCPVCRNLSPKAKGLKLKWDERPYKILKRRSHGLFEESAARGCKFCSLMCGILQDLLCWDSQRSSEVTTWLSKDSVVVLSQSGPSGTAVYMYAPAGWPPAWEELRQTPPLSYNASPGQYSNFIQTQLRICTETHDMCRQEIPPLPKRVLDLGEDESTIRLIEPTDIRASYAALSHCWGQSSHMTTKTGTLELRKKRIEWKFLPPTFRDAITVTRNLSLQYLWIDSLCILQDSQDDWSNQSIQMGEIYRNACFTIAATSAGSSGEHFLKSSSTTSMLLPFGGGDAPETMVEVRNWDANHKNQPLDKRAWAFQEYHLSTRLIEFRTGDISFRCMAGETCECNPTREWTTPRLTYTAIYTEDESRLHNTWYEAVMNYSGRALTYPSDTFPALSGLAALVHDRTGWQYVAGLWRESILFGLLWVAVYTEPLYRAPEAELAPSFSWGSVQHEVSWPYRQESNYALLAKLVAVEKRVVLDAHCTIVGGNPFGQVADGHVTLKGRAVSVTVSTSGPKRSIPYDVEYPFGMEGYFSEDMALGPCEVKDTNGTACASVRRLKREDVEAPFSTRALAFSVDEWEMGEGRYWLILGLSTKESGAYMRVGLYRPFPHENNADDVERLWKEYSGEAIIKIV